MSDFPSDILDPDSLAEALIKSCTPPGGGLHVGDKLRALVELLVMYIPLDNYEAVLREWAAQPEGAHLTEVVRETAGDCGHCEELRVVGPDHRNTRNASHDENCAEDVLGRVMEQRGFAAAVDAIRGKKPVR